MAPVALIRLCRREILRKEEVRTVRARQKAGLSRRWISNLQESYRVLRGREREENSHPAGGRRVPDLGQ